MLRSTPARRATAPAWAGVGAARSNRSTANMSAITMPSKPHSVAQDPGQKVGVGDTRHAVDVVVGGHHAERPGLDAGPGRRQVDLGELARPDRRPRAVATADRGALPREVLEHHRDAVAHPAHERPHAQRREQRVLAEAFFRPAPPRVAQQVQPGHQRDMYAAGPQLGRRMGRRLLDQVGPPGRRGGRGSSGTAAIRAPGGRAAPPRRTGPECRTGRRRRPAPAPWPPGRPRPPGRRRWTSRGRTRRRRAAARRARRGRPSGPAPRPGPGWSRSRRPTGSRRANRAAAG